MRYYFNLLFLVVLFILSSCNQSEEAKEDPSKEPIYSKDKIEEIFYGKPENFVMKRLGEPDKKQELFAIDKTWWIYYHIGDSKEVKFRFDKWIEGKVDKIEFR